MGSAMNRMLSMLAVVLLLVPVAGGAGEARIGLLCTLDSDPPIGDVTDLLEKQLAPLEVRVDPVVVETLPVNAEQWVEAASKAGREQPGMIAFFGYRCAEATCGLFIVEPGRKTFLEMPVKPLDSETSTGKATALAVTIREALLGPLFPEQKRLASVGENLDLSSANVEPTWWKPPLEDQRRQSKATLRPPWWIEGGYQGESAFPGGGHPTSGAWVGIQYAPLTWISVGLSIGWLGIEETTATPGTVRTHRITSLLSTSFNFPIGPAVISVAPVVRFDTVLVETIPTDSSQTNSTELEIQLGATMIWHVPIIPKLEALLGVGLLGSVLSNDYGIDSPGSDYDDMVPASAVRLLWIVGVAWSPPEF